MKRRVITAVLTLTIAGTVASGLLARFVHSYQEHQRTELAKQLIAAAIAVSIDPEQKQAVLWVADHYRVMGPDESQKEHGTTLVITPMSTSESLTSDADKDVLGQHQPRHNRIVLMPMDIGSTANTRGHVLAHECLHNYLCRTRYGSSGRRQGTRDEEERTVLEIQGRNNILLYGELYGRVLAAVESDILWYYRKHHISIGDAPYPKVDVDQVVGEYGEKMQTEDDCRVRSHILVNHAFYRVVDRYAGGSATHKAFLKDAYTQIRRIQTEEAYRRARD